MLAHPCREFVVSVCGLRRLGEQILVPGDPASVRVGAALHGRACILEKVASLACSERGIKPAIKVRRGIGEKLKSRHALSLRGKRPKSLPDPFYDLSQRFL